MSNDSFHSRNSASSRREAPGPNPSWRWEPWLTAHPPILIVTDDDRVAEKLAAIFREAGLRAERARTMTDACESTRLGRFPLVVTAPQLTDGSWKRLALIAREYRPGFAIILLAKKFDFRQWAEAIEDDVLDALYELPKAAEAAKRALWTEYLTGAWPNFAIPGPKQIS